MRRNLGFPQGSFSSSSLLGLKLRQPRVPCIRSIKGFRYLNLSSKYCLPAYLQRHYIFPVSYALYNKAFSYTWMPPGCLIWASLRIFSKVPGQRGFGELCSKAGNSDICTLLPKRRWQDRSSFNHNSLSECAGQLWSSREQNSSADMK